MRRKSKKEISRDIGLEISYLFGNYFLKLEHLHYGYWTEGLAVDIANLHIAQNAYVNFITSHIPEGVKTILDVGCGAGQIDKVLIEKGYEVDCLSPSSFFNSKVKKLLNGESHLFETSYEEFQTESKYDLVMFCESFEYLDMEKALSKTSRLLNENGYMLICDLFKKELLTKGVIGGGQKLNKFQELIENAPFSLIEQKDITERVAPTMDLMNDVLQKVIKPALIAGVEISESRYRTATRLVRWIYRKKIEKLNNKYFSENRSGEKFKERKIYQLLLYQKID